MAGAFEDRVATKAGLIEVKAELKQDISSIRTDIASETIRYRPSLRDLGIPSRLTPTP